MARFEVYISDDGLAEIDGEPLVPVPGQSVHEVVLDHLHRYAVERGAAVEATVTERPDKGHFVLEVAPDGSSRLLEPEPEPEPELDSQPAYEPQPEPAYEPEPEPEIAYEPEPQPEPEPEPVYEPEPESEIAYEPEPEREPEPVYEPVYEPVFDITSAPEPDPAPVPEPEPEPEPAQAPAPTPDPAPRPTPVSGSIIAAAVARAAAAAQATTSTPAPAPAPAAPAPAPAPAPAQASAPTPTPALPAELAARIRHMTALAQAGRLDEAYGLASELRRRLTEEVGADDPHAVEALAVEAYIAHLRGDHREAVVLALAVARIRCGTGDRRAPEDVARAVAAWQRLDDERAIAVHGHELLHMWERLSHRAPLSPPHAALAKRIRRRVRELEVFA
ncbi:hypothetical protein [Streptomyces fumanus]|uniref:hypothetical protein n=1 Tax=Streptomyces fumanus TaxID=67302 RepID=UPI0033FAA77E